MWDDLPPGFTLVDDDKEAKTKTKAKRSDRSGPAPSPESLAPTGEAHDGDTYRTAGGLNARLGGVDAFEVDQQGRDLNGNPVDLGGQARAAFLPYAQPGATASANGTVTYGRPVVSLNSGGRDAAEGMVSSGYALPEPRFLTPDQLGHLVGIQRDAIAGERGAYAGQYQYPWDFRQQGEGAPWVGKTAMADGDAAEWEAMLRDPRTTASDVSAWLAKRGHSADNIGNILDLLRRNHQAQAQPYYQQPDVTGAPVAPAKPFWTRQGAALTEGVVDAAGMPGEAAKVGVFGIPGQAVSSLLNNIHTEYGKDAQGRDSIIFSWKPNAPKAPLPELTVKARPAVGPMAPDEVGAFAGDTKPKTGHRYAPDEEAEMRAAYNTGDLGQVIALADRYGKPYGITLSREGLQALRKKGAAFRISYVPTDQAALAAHDEAARAAEAPLGAEALRELAHRGLNVGQLDESYAAQSTPERYLQAVERMLPSAVIPAAGEGLAAARLTKAMMAMNAGGAAGAGIGGQVAGDLAPGSPVAALAGQLLGGGLGGLGARRLASRSALPDAPQPVGDGGAPATPPSEPATHTITGDSLRGLTDAGGEVDMHAAGQVLRHAADSALANGDHVTLHVEGQPVEIVGPDLTDAKGQRWGAMPILADESGANRLEITRNRSEAMRAEDDIPTLEGPSVPREPDRIDVNTGPRPLLDSATEMQRRAAAERMGPGDVLPIPASEVGGLDEAMAIDKSRYPAVKAADENKVLDSRGLSDPKDGTRTVRTRGPVDLIQWIRANGGLKAQDSSLEHMGLNNAPRTGLDFTGNEGRLGPLISPDGMTYDDAAMRAHEAGYFPDKAEPPSISDFLDAVGDTHSGQNRRFLPEDQPEIDAFEAARAQRMAVAGADQEGAPLHEDRGQPVSLDDLDANTAPVHAYEGWGENAPDFAGNIRLENLDSPQAIKRALVNVEKYNGGFDAAKRGKITQAETEALAADLNMTPQKLLSRRKGEAFNAEQALAARQILAKSGNELVNAARKLKSKQAAGEASDNDLAAFREALVRHAAIQEQVSGATAEAGRTLAQFRMKADSRAVRGDVLKCLIEAGGGEKTLDKAADIILDHATDPKRLNQDAKALVKPTIWDKLLEYRFNAMLAGPRTHAVNITSNLLTGLLQIPEHGAAAAIGAPRRLFSGKAADRVLFSEVGARTVGMMQGAKEGLGAFAKTMRTGETSDFGGSKVEVQKRAIGGTAGKVIRIPTRLLEAEDEFFKAAARRSDIVGMAIRQAAKEGLTGQAARTRAAELAATPTPEMISHALDYGKYVTFQSKLGKIGNGVMTLSNAHPVMKLFIPFVRTPMNLLKFAVERSPAAPMLSEWRADMKAGGARRDLAIARATLGSGAMMLTLKAAQQGLITGGGPADDSAKRLMQANGWQPYSVKVGDHYVSYNRLDPLSTTLGIAADYVDLQSHMTDKERSRVAELLVSSTLQNLSNKSWLSGMSDLANAVSNPQRYGMKEVSSVATSMVPAVLSQGAQAIDPSQREAMSIIDRIKARIPFMSKALPARRDVMGQPVDNASGGGVEAFSPMFVSAGKNDPTLQALIDSGVHIGAPSKNYTGDDGVKREMTPEQFSKYQSAMGAAAKPELDALVADPDWKTMNFNDRQSEVASIMRDARETAREQALGAGPSAAQPVANGLTASQLVEQAIANRKQSPDWRKLSPAERSADLARIAAGVRRLARDIHEPSAGELPPGFVISPEPPPGFVVQPH